MKIEKEILYGLASIYALLEHTEPLFVLKKWEDECKCALPDTPRAQPKKQEITDADIDDVYALYPTRDAQNNNRSVTKGAKSKAKIRSILEKGDITKDVLISIVKQEVARNKNEGKWLKDFTAFLNDLPDLSKEESPKEEKGEKFKLW